MTFFFTSLCSEWKRYDLKFSKETNVLSLSVCLINMEPTEKVLSDVHLTSQNTAVDGHTYTGRLF